MTLKEGQPEGDDNIPAVYVQAGGQTMTDVMMLVCKKYEK